MTNNSNESFMNCLHSSFEIKWRGIIRLLNQIMIYGITWQMFSSSIPLPARVEVSFFVQLLTGSSILSSVTCHAKCVPCCLLHDLHVMIQSWMVRILWLKSRLLLDM